MSMMLTWRFTWRFLWRIMRHISQVCIRHIFQMRMFGKKLERIKEFLAGKESPLRRASSERPSLAMDDDSS